MNTSLDIVVEAGLPRMLFALWKISMKQRRKPHCKGDCKSTIAFQSTSRTIPHRMDVEDICIWKFSKVSKCYCLLLLFWITHIPVMTKRWVSRCRCWIRWWKLDPHVAMATCLQRAPPTTSINPIQITNGYLSLMDGHRIASVQNSAMDIWSMKVVSSLNLQYLALILATYQNGQGVLGAVINHKAVRSCGHWIVYCRNEKFS